MPHDAIMLLGVNHKTTPLEIREKLALTDGYEEPLAALDTMPGLREYYLLSTCNRVEVLCTTNDEKRARQQLLEFLFGDGIEAARADQYVYQYSNDEAIKHLFTVAASLDSMIVGEAQILGQLKEAFRYASDHGATGLILNKLLHKSFSVAKRVRTETAIGANAVSISYAAVELSKKIFGRIDDKTVMLVGAGEMAELAAEHLVGQGIAEIVVANRTLERAVNLARRFNGRAVSLDELIDQLATVDIIISSTGAPELILTKADVKPVMRRRRNRPLFFIDIAVPRDLDPAINNIDNVYLYDIDDLQHVVDLNREERDREAVKAARIVEEETIKFVGWLDNIEVKPTIIDLRNRIDSICRSELDRTLGRLRNLSDKEKKSLEKMASAIASKVLHHPLQYLKSNSSNQDRHFRVNLIRDLYGLDRQSDAGRRNRADKR